MRPCVVGLCLLVLLGCPRADAKSVALIWKGSKVESEAKAQRAAWDKIGAFLEKTKLELPEGYPKLVRSDTLAGLKPGFWVWLVGICDPAGAATALEHLKVVAPDSYSREVKGVDPECPSSDGDPLVARDEKLTLPEGAKVQVFSREESESPEGDEPGDSFTQTRYFFLLVGKRGELLSSADVVGEEDFTGDPRQGPTAYRCELDGIKRSGKSALVLTRSCRAGLAECGSTVGATEITTVTVSGTTLATATRKENEEKMDCGE